MRCVVVLALALPAVALAAPIPPERDSDKLHRLYGKPVDPDKDCKFGLLDGDRLRIRVPGKHHSLHLGPGWFNSPRILRQVKGDFVATVRVTDKISPKVGSALPKREPYAGGGIVVFSGLDTRVQLRRTHKLFKTGHVSPVEYGYDCPRTHYLATGNPPFNPKPMYLRLTRSGNTVKFEHSDDGKTWKTASEQTVPLADTVSVGLYVNNNFNAAYEVVFDHYDLTPVTAKPEN